MYGKGEERRRAAARVWQSEAREARAGASGRTSGVVMESVSKGSFPLSSLDAAFCHSARAEDAADARSTSRCRQKGRRRG